MSQLQLEFVLLLNQSLCVGSGLRSWQNSAPSESFTMPAGAMIIVSTRLDDLLFNVA